MVRQSAGLVNDSPTSTSSLSGSTLMFPGKAQQLLCQDRDWRPSVLPAENCHVKDFGLAAGKTIDQLYKSQIKW
eukprot:s548_g13.t1